MIEKKLEVLFLIIVFLATGVLGMNYYKTYEFKHNPLPKENQKRILRKEEEVLSHMQKYFGLRVKFPVVVTSKIPGRLYGLTSYKSGKITIYLNKNVMQESMDYIVNDVIPHEYAHALLFYLHKSSNKSGGHSALWKQTCQKLGGLNCRRFVNQHEVIMEKVHNF